MVTPLIILEVNMARRISNKIVGDVMVHYSNRKYYALIGAVKHFPFICAFNGGLDI